MKLLHLLLSAIILLTIFSDVAESKPKYKKSKSSSSSSKKDKKKSKSKKSKIKIKFSGGDYDNDDYYDDYYENNDYDNDYYDHDNPRYIRDDDNDRNHVGCEPSKFTFITYDD